MSKWTIFLCVLVTAAMSLSLALQAQTPPRVPGPTKGTALRVGAGALEYPSSWTEQHYANVTELWNTSRRMAEMDPEERDSVAKIETSVTPCANHAEALHRLREIEAESGMTSTYTVIGGWPALERRQLVRKPVEGDADAATSGKKLVMVTTAIAAGSTVVRIDGFAPENASQQLIQEMEDIGRSWRPNSTADAQAAAKEVQQLRTSPSLRKPPPSPGGRPIAAVGEATVGSPASSRAVPGAAVDLGVLDLFIGSESEVAVSSNGTYVVVAQQCSDSNSIDGGNTFLRGVSPGNCTGGDSSLAVGQSGNFYWSTIGTNKSDCTAPCKNNTQEIAVSTNNGQNFTFSANVVDCLVTSGCGFGNVPDQEHIAADRFNASATSQDQVYLVFRKGYGFGISCSTDSASTWSSVAFYNNGSTDFPRLVVSQNGTVFVITNNGNNIELWSFSSCKSGLTLGLNHQTVVSGINQVSCPVSGLDRCNDGNLLSSHMVAVDDTNANHLYVSYASNTAGPLVSNGSFGANENVYVVESKNGGSTWSSSVQVNQGGSGRRYQPWVCVTEGTAYISWLDRRNSTSSANDLTDYFASSAFDSGGSLTGGTDFRINVASDPECAPGWPCWSRSQYDSLSCSTQPQFGGACRHTPNNSSDSFQNCNFASPSCTDPTETCQVVGNGGCPKYADYTANACILGRFFTAWPSATSQPPATGSGTNINSYFNLTVVGSTATTLTYTGDTTGVYHHTAHLSAAFVLKGTSVPITGQLITLTLGTQNCTGTTNTSGIASCSLTLNQVPGPYTVTASFAGSGNYQASSAPGQPFTINQEQTTTTYTGPTLIADGVPTSFSAVLKEDVGTPISGRTIQITLGTGGTAQTCTTGPTDATGSASCTITPNQLFATTVDADFLGDSYYLPSSNSAATALNVTSEVTVSTTPFQPNRSSRDPQSCTVITVDNPNLPPDRTTRSTTIAGPLEVLVTSLAPTATLVSPAGTFTGSPFTGSPFVILQPLGLPPGGEVNASLCFLDPSGAPITFTPVIVSGVI